MRSTRSSNDGARVPDPSILTPPAGRSRDLQGTTKLECQSGSDREARADPTPPTAPHTPGPAVARRTNLAEIANRELSSMPDTAFSSTRWRGG
jgi:hypothetical protein